MIFGRRITPADVLRHSAEAFFTARVLAQDGDLIYPIA